MNVNMDVGCSAPVFGGVVVKIGGKRWKLIIQRGRQYFAGKPANYIVDANDHTLTVLDEGSPVRLATATAMAVNEAHRVQWFGSADSNVSLIDGDYLDLPQIPLLPDDEGPESSELN